MTIRFLTAAAALVAFSASAFAQTISVPTNADECAALVEQTEISVEEFAATDDGANDLLLELDEACADGDFDRAAAAANKLIDVARSNG